MIRSKLEFSMKKRTLNYILIISMALFIFVLVGVLQPTQVAAETTSEIQSGTVMQDDGLLWLVNRSHPIPNTYVPKNLTAPLYSSHMLRSEATDAFEKMKSGVYASGCGWISCKSGYRTYGTQTSLFNGRVAEKKAQGMSYLAAYEATAKFTAIPGTSEHQTGLAVDVTNTGNLTSDFANTKAGAWLKENSWRYGYILRYTENKYNVTKIGDEPWHFRYVGMPHSKLIYDNKFCYEEYIEALIAGKIFTVDNKDGMVYKVFRTTKKGEIYPGMIGYSSDNAGGFIVTTFQPVEDKMMNVYASCL